MSSPVRLRHARHRDLDAILSLQHASLRQLGASYYDVEAIESLITNFGTMDARLLDDGTYFVAEADGSLAACGGWTMRTPAYYSAETGIRPGGPEVRSVYVAPGSARSGHGRFVMAAIEAEIAAAGHSRVSLVAMLGAIPFYRRLGYSGSKPLVVRLPDEMMITGIRMAKRLGLPADQMPEAA